MGLFGISSDSPRVSCVHCQRRRKHMKKPSPKEQHVERTWLSVLPQIIGGIFWICLILVCFIFRDEITVDRVVNFTPKNPILAICVILLCFALKSVTVVIYGGILYAASGILFPLPIAIAVNFVGGFLMTSIPFWIGKRSGTKMMDRLVQKNPKLELLRSIPKRNEWFVSFAVRIVGILPSDLVSMYLGASDLRYIHYIVGTMAGLLPSVINFSVMGMSLNDVSSPAFRISVGCEIGLMALSLLYYLIWHRRRKSRKEHME